MSPAKLVPVAITPQAFAAFGDVITARDAELRLINNGTTQRFHDLAKIEAAGEGSRVIASIFRGQAFAPPITISMLERHPLGSQAFVPLHERPWLVVVAPDHDGKPGDPVCFLVRPDRHGIIGVNYARNVWHHPLISLQAESDFLVIDRSGEGTNLEEYFFETPHVVESLD